MARRVRAGLPQPTALTGIAKSAVMPTPFMHLQIAERLLDHPELLPAVRDRLVANWPAFYLGSVAADVQTITNASRSSTHFYKIPPSTDVVAFDQMLVSFPELAVAAVLTPAHAVMVAAYRAHLLADIRWFWDMTNPFFLEPIDWPVDHYQRFLVHNILLAYLDAEAVAALPAGAGGTLAAAEPAGWLPFVSDDALRRWRDMLADQLQPGVPVATVAIYASRMQIQADEFSARLANPEWMAKRVFKRVPLAALQASTRQVLDESVQLLNSYLLPHT